MVKFILPLSNENVNSSFNAKLPVLLLPFALNNNLPITFPHSFNKSVEPTKLSCIVMKIVFQ